MPLDFGGSHGFQEEAEGEISHHGGGGRTLVESLGFQGGQRGISHN